MRFLIKKKTRTVRKRCCLISDQQVKNIKIVLQDLTSRPFFCLIFYVFLILPLRFIKTGNFYVNKLKFVNIEIAGLTKRFQFHLAYHNRSTRNRKIFKIKRLKTGFCLKMNPLPDFINGISKIKNILIKFLIST